MIFQFDWLNNTDGCCCQCLLVIWTVKLTGTWHCNEALYKNIPCCLDLFLKYLVPHAFLCLWLICEYLIDFTMLSWSEKWSIESNYPPFLTFLSLRYTPPHSITVFINLHGFDDLCSIFFRKLLWTTYFELDELAIYYLVYEELPNSTYCIAKWIIRFWLQGCS